MSEPQSDPCDDPEIAKLLEFEPVPRRFEREDGWTPALQRRFIAHLALTGSPGKACDALGKRRSGIDKLAKLKGAASFRDAWARAIEIAQERKARSIEAEHAGARDIKLPFVDHRRKHWLSSTATPGPLPGQILNHLGEWEDEASVMRRVEEAKDSVSRKLLNARRLYLQEIAGSPGKRAAFEMLTRLPIDWQRARRLEPQDDEPFRKPNMRKPDMLLTAENGWLGEVAHGPDKKAELRAALDAWRAKQKLEPIDWESGDDEW